MVDEESIELGVNATPQFIGSLMELVWAQIGESSLCTLTPSKAKAKDGSSSISLSSSLSSVLLSCVFLLTSSLFHPLAGNAAVDLESFAKHAGRNKIKTDDVMLLTRRNDGLAELLTDELNKIEAERKRKAG